MRRASIYPVAALLLATLILAACAPAAQAPPATAAPTAAAKPASAPTQGPSASGATKTGGFPAKDKAITLVVPFAAGGSTDTGARVLAPVMERELGTTVQVVNKPGASTQIALAELAGAPPDGYNIGFMAISTSLITYLDTSRKATYSRKDFQPVATYTTEPNALVVKADSPFKSVQDVLDAAKARPGEVTVATPSLMGSSHLPMLILEKMTGTRFKYVHFDGGAPVISALLGGHVQVASAAASQFLALHKSGEVRMLGMMDTERSKFYPDAPTLPELGYDLSAPSTYGLIVPDGTPMEVVNTLSEAIRKSMEDPGVQTKLADFGLATRYRNPQEFAAFWDEQEKHVQEALQLAKQ